MQPEASDSKCPHCGRRAVALNIPGNSVTWCEFGHVSVWSDLTEKTAKLVYTFEN